MQRWTNSIQCRSIELLYLELSLTRSPEAWTVDRVSLADVVFGGNDEWQMKAMTRKKRKRTEASERGAGGSFALRPLVSVSGHSHVQSQN